MVWGGGSSASLHPHKWVHCSYGKDLQRELCHSSPFLSLLSCEDRALPPREDMATKCHLGSRQCPHQKVQPVDVLILDFSKLTESWEIWCL